MANPYVNGDMQGNKTHQQVADWITSQGYGGAYGGGQPIDWLRNTGRIGDFENFIGVSQPPPPPRSETGTPYVQQQAPQQQAPAGPFSGNPFSQGGFQGTRSNADVGRWFEGQGYTGPFEGGAALNWAYNNDLFGDYSQFITPQQNMMFPSFDLFGGFTAGGLGGLGGFGGGNTFDGFNVQPLPTVQFGQQQTQPREDGMRRFDAPSGGGGSAWGGPWGSRNRWAP